MTPTDLIGIGSRVYVKTSCGEELRGRFTERVTYSDRTEGAYVELYEGPVIVVPLSDLRLDALDRTA